MKMFARGKHVGGGNPPSNRIPKPAVTAKGSTTAKGQFGRPSGSTVASPPSVLNGKGKGIGKGKGYAGTY